MTRQCTRRRQGGNVTFGPLEPSSVTGLSPSDAGSSVQSLPRAHCRIRHCRQYLHMSSRSRTPKCRWDGDGMDEIGLHRESTGFFYWRNTLDTRIASDEIFFGNPADRFVAGDWGIVDDIDTPAVFRPSSTTFFFRHTLTQGNADSQFVFCQPGWLPVAGDFGFG